MQVSRPNAILAIVVVFLGLLAPTKCFPIIGEPFVPPEFLPTTARANPAIPEAIPYTRIPYTPSTAAPKENAYPSPSTYSYTLQPESTTTALSSRTAAEKIQSTVATTTSSTDAPELAATSAITTSSIIPSDVPTSPPANAGQVDDSAFEHFSLKPHQAKPLWTHKDSVGWHSKFPTCGGSQQSPIDIQPKSTVLTAYPKFTFHNYGNLISMELINNGHSAVYNLPPDYPTEEMPHITGGGLDDTFAFVQFHLHWGSESSKGSEHLIKSKGYPGELHLVHFNTKYGSFAEASQHSDGVAVLGIFLKVGPSDSQSFQPLVEQLGEISKDGDETVLRKPVALNDILPGRTSSFYRYSGSLTTPNCQQIVIWTIFDNPIEISEKQLDKFRSLQGDDGFNMVNNFRPTLPVNGRTVFYRSFTGCEISRSWPITSSPFSEAYKWSKCLMGFAYKSVAPSLL
ncbi:carbonic anhydrase 2-like isoform X2 [Daphnia pulicaria]|uniref:carbonic anhydrase 2-like isoform X2 n=1 Tax=Daphnia pulicaria TaxID=35523 RepID=UPI001EEB5FEB|nr:carbonic anhydrase 2-like isoform X2 [Daphnia pulicaria]